MADFFCVSGVKPNYKGCTARFLVQLIGHLANRNSFNLHFVSGQCACFVAEQVLNLAEFLD
jgi:hypothetical protein